MPAVIISISNQAIRQRASFASIARRHMTSDVTVATMGSLAKMTLSRPKALNALTLPMIQTLTAAIQAAVEDAAVQCIWMDGAGEKAFCAGGDVRAVWDVARPGAETDGSTLVDAFFREEYSLNMAIKGCPKPQVSIWDGFVMGGGAGLSVHGRHCVATEKTAFAMPEVSRSAQAAPTIPTACVHPPTSPAAWQTNIEFSLP